MKIDKLMKDRKSTSFWKKEINNHVLYFLTVFSEGMNHLTVGRGFKLNSCTSLKWVRQRDI